MSLVSRGVLMSDSTSCSNSIVSNTAGSCSEGTCSITSVALVHHLAHVVLSLLGLSLEASHGTIVSGIALSQLGHEVSVKHCLSHLDLLLAGVASLRAIDAEAANSSLIENLILLVCYHVTSIDVWKHLVNS